MNRWAVQVTRIRQSGEKDQYGDPVPGEKIRSSLPDALFAPGTSAEPVSNLGQTVITEPTVYWPHAWPDVRAEDRLEIQGVEWMVEGKPALWPLGTIATLKGVER